MSSIIPPKGCPPPTIETLKVGKKTLKITIYENENIVNIFIGGHDIFCIDALLHKPSSMFVKLGYTNMSEGFLSHIYYHMNCSLESNFQRGVDTNMILRVLLSYIKDKYPFVKTMRFNDSSTRVCDNGHVVALPLMSYIRTGKTWYESDFHAYLDSNDALKFQNEQERFQKVKHVCTWETMKEYMTGDFPLPEEDLRSMFESAETWQGFFGTLSNVIGISKFCIFIAPWIDRFMDAFFRFKFASATYIFPIERIPQQDYTVSPYSRGGRRHTRKRWNDRIPKNET